MRSQRRSSDAVAIQIINSSVVATSEWKTDAFGSIVSTVAFDNGTVLKDVMTDGVMDRLLREGAAGRYFFSKDCAVLLAVTDTEGRTHRADPEIVRTRRGQHFSVGMAGLMIGLPFLIIFIGIPFVAKGWRASVVASKLRKIERQLKHLEGAIAA
jgi:hypothetical protein